MTTSQASATTESAAPAISWTAFEAERRAHRAAAEAIRPLNKGRLFDTLTDVAVTRVELAFDGYGDEGQIESVNAFTVDGPIELPDIEVTLATLGWRDTEPNDTAMSLSGAIEHLAYDLLATTHAGWENNDGAYGTFTFSTGDRTITLEHNERFTDVQCFEHEF